MVQKENKAPPPALSRTVHATCLAIAGRGVLLTGPSGSGKSDLALRLIQEPGGKARLVGDDQVIICRAGERLVVRPAPILAGRMEVRGIGIVRLDHEPETIARLVAAMTPASQVPRLPKDCRQDFFGIKLPLVRLAPFEASAPCKVRLALERACRQDEDYQDGDMETMVH